MNLNSKQLSFGQVISHVFPGFVFLFLMILWFIEFNSLNLNEIVHHALHLRWNSQISIFAVFIFIGTILGVLIDAAHHLFDDLLERLRIRNNSEMQHLYILNKEQLDIYSYFVDEQLYYYYEAYFNLIIATLPLYALVPFVHFNIFASYSIILLFHILLGIETNMSYQIYYDTHEIMMTNFKK